MKTKKILAGILCAGFCLSSMTACTGNGGNADGQGSEATAAQAKTEQLHKLTVRAPKKITEITASTNTTWFTCPTKRPRAWTSPSTHL